MDLTKATPRSVSSMMLGIVQLARTTDKAKALVHGNIADYKYDCPMDHGLFEYLDMEPEAFLNVVRGRRTIPRSKRMRRHSSPRKILVISKPSTRSGCPQCRPESR